MERWSPDSWRSKPIVQVPTYKDEAALADVEKQIAGFPPLVFAGEARKLKSQLAKVCAGEAFLLQGGDCAESFAEHSADNIRDFFRVFLQMAVVMTYGASMPVVKLGRIAGQFAKPRSAPMETIDGVALPSYRGDIVNDIEFTPASARTRSSPPADVLPPVGGDAEPFARIRDGRLRESGKRPSLDARLRQRQPAVRALRQARRPHHGNPRFHARHRAWIRSITRRLRQTDVYTSHEALLLGYEQALTRVDSTSGEHYACSGHFLWIGDRTRQPDHAHVEYMRGIKNPIGLKCGPSTTPDGLLQLIDILNPANEPGRLTLISRFGAEKVGDHLPALIRAVQREGRSVVWSCDPMHGNTVTASGYKTRPFDKVMQEIRSFFDVHRAEGSYAGGIHLEMTGNNVTECTGGARALSEADLRSRYMTYCDPRLNAEQAIEVAFLVAEKLKRDRLASAVRPRGGVNGPNGGDRTIFAALGRLSVALALSVASPAAAQTRMWDPTNSESVCEALRAAIDATPPATPPRRRRRRKFAATTTAWPRAPTPSAATTSNSCSSDRRRRPNAAGSSDGSPRLRAQYESLRARAGDTGRRQALIAQYAEQCGDLPREDEAPRQAEQGGAVRRRRGGLRAQVRRLLFPAHAGHEQRADQPAARPLPGPRAPTPRPASIPARPIPTFPMRSRPIRATATTTCPMRSSSPRNSNPPAPAASRSRAGPRFWAAPNKS